jgi:hypothetical protein
VADATVQADIYHQAIPGGGMREVRKTTGVLAENTVVDATTATLTVTADLHGGKTITLNRAAGIAVTLPDATGTGVRFRFVVGTTVTSNSTTIKVPDAANTMTGRAYVETDGASDLVIAFGTGATADTITLDGSTTGGIKGDIITVEDIAADLWSVLVQTSATGTEATPFSATVA